MEEYVFSGRIYPDTAEVRMYFDRNIRNDDIDLSVDIRIFASRSDLAVIATPSRVVDVETLRNYVSEGVETVLDSLTFELARAFNIEIRSVILPNGEQAVFTSQIAGIVDGPGACSASYLTVLRSVETWPRLAYVLADLRTALQDAGSSPFYCYRAVEGVSTYWQLGKAARWAAMQQALRIDEQFLKDIKSHADKIRHGEYLTVTAGARHLLLRAAWIVVGRFVALVDSGVEELPRESYPQLSSQSAA